MRPLSPLLGIALMLSGCATTLTHPSTGQQWTCQSGAWWGFGTIGAPIAVIGNLLEIFPYRACIAKAKAAGFKEPEAEAEPLPGQEDLSVDGARGDPGPR